MVTNNLKIIATSLTLLCSLILSVQAKANDKIAPYIGAGYQFNQLNHQQENFNLSTGSLSVDYDDYLESDFNNFNLFAGFNLKDTNFAFELGYFKSDWESKSNNNTGLVWSDNSNPFGTRADSQLEIISLDAIYNHKIPNHDKFSFLAIGGLSKISFDSTIYFLESGLLRESVSDSQDGYGLNFGVGLEADIIDNLSVRTIIKYTTVNSIDAFDSLVSYNVGFKYQF